MEVIFNDAMPLMAAHMVIAAYVVGGFLVASVYAVGMLRGRRDRYHRLGFLIPFTVAAIAIPIQMGVGDSLARWVYNNQPVKFAAIELVPETASDVPETLLGHLNDDGTVSAAGSRSRAWRRGCRTRSTGKDTVVQGLDTVPADERPTDRQVNTVHLAWDVMVGLGTLLLLLSLWYGPRGCSAATCRRASWFLRIASHGGRPRRDHDGGRLGGQRGRSPAVDRLRADEGGGRGHRQHRVWITFVAVVILYAGAGRHHHPGAAGHEPPVPRTAEGRRGRRALRADGRRPERRRADGAGRVSTAAAHRPVRRRHRVRHLRRRRLRGRLLGPHRRRDRARRAAAGGDRPLDRPGVGGEPRVADLLLRRAVDVLPRGLRVDHPHAVRPAHHRRLRHRAAGRELRVPQGGAPHPRPPELRRRCSRSRRCSCPYCMGAVAGAIASGRVPAGGEAGDPWTAGSTPRRSWAACWRCPSSRTSPPSTWCGTPGGSTTRWSSTSGAVPSAPRSWPASSRSSGSSCSRPTPSTCSTVSRRAPCPW